MNLNELKTLLVRHMTFAQFQAMNARRCEQAFKHYKGATEWPIQNWVLAICGEAGEAANLVKKVLRGDLSLDHARESLLKELADIMTYCDVAITILGGETGQVINDKFEEVNKRVGWIDIDASLAPPSDFDELRTVTLTDYHWRIIALALKSRKSSKTRQEMTTTDEDERCSYRDDAQFAAETCNEVARQVPLEDCFKCQS
jgi:NTP pyrophosphatase (non-canonical NTP hydrolase)